MVDMILGLLILKASQGWIFTEGGRGEIFHRLSMISCYLAEQIHKLYIKSISQISSS